MPSNLKKLPEPSQSECEAISVAQRQRDRRAPRVRVRLSQKRDGGLAEFGPTHRDHHGWLVRLENAFGTRGTDFALSQLNRLITASRDRPDGPIDESRLNAMMAFVEGANAINELEAALAVQMAMTNSFGQMLLLRAQRADQIPQFEAAANSAAKILRLFAIQAETLSKLKRGGQQVVKVVHIHPGAQAIVGNVSTGKAASGGGGIDESAGQPHAKERIAASASPTMPEMWSENSKREAVPISERVRSEEMSDAWRGAGQRCAEG